MPDLRCSSIGFSVYPCDNLWMAVQTVQTANFDVFDVPFVESCTAINRDPQAAFGRGRYIASRDSGLAVRMRRIRYDAVVRSLAIKAARHRRKGVGTCVYFESAGHLFQRFDGRHRMSVFNAGDIATQQTSTLFNVPLRQVQFFPEST
jgi:hypothetical protein